MTCKCGKKTAEGLKYCKKCFLRIFEKRIRRELQRYPWFKKKEKVIILDDGTCKMGILKQQVLPLLEDVRVQIKIGKKKIKGCRIISPENLEDVVGEFLEKVLENKKFKADNVIRPLRQITDKEINKYAEFKSLQYFKRKKNDILKFVDAMEKDYPETKFALLKVSQKIQK